jgi:hypothetical protein|tara:strand:+ start:2418 stop:2534 length:117 start_codon:yes stop_codon:yes gene_type:complete
VKVSDARLKGKIEDFTDDDSGKVARNGLGRDFSRKGDK